MANHTSYNKYGHGVQNNNTGSGIQNNYYDHKINRDTDKCMRALFLTNPEDDMERIESSKDKLLKECYEWILDNEDLQNFRSSDSKQQLFHIAGDAGKGKTMLMIALVREFLSNIGTGRDALTFFFCQSTDQRLNSAASVLRGLIWKLAHDHPSLAKHILERYNHQGKRLYEGTNSIHGLFSILSNMIADPSLEQVYLFIDALDECDHQRRELLLLIVGKACDASSKAKWLVSRRNYRDIVELLEQDNHRQVLSLELNAEHISQAVATFIDCQADYLAKTNKYDQRLQSRIKSELRDKADSTFLWVSLVCKELLRIPGDKALETLLELPSGLKSLYKRMLERISHIESEVNITIYLRILRSMILAVRPLSLDELSIVAELPTDETERKPIEDYVSNYGTFVTVRNRTVSLVHKSVKDFFVEGEGLRIYEFGSGSGSGMKAEHCRVVRRCLLAMKNILTRNMCRLKPGSPVNPEAIDREIQAIHYACCLWVDHLDHSFKLTSPNPIFNGDLKRKRKRQDDQQEVVAQLKEDIIQSFLSKYLLHWFEALGIFSSVPAGVQSLWRLSKLAKDQGWEELYGFVCDATRLILYCQSGLESAPLQVYSSALAFAPKKSLVRNMFEKESMCNWIRKLPPVEDNWSPLRQNVEDFPGAVNYVAFSPDSKMLAASDDETVKLWDVSVGSLQQTLEGHSGCVNSVSFSPNGKLLASGSKDKMVKLWDMSKFCLLHTLEGHLHSVSSVTFSLNSKLVASGSVDNMVKLWDVSMGSLHQTLEGHSDFVNSVSFAPNGELLASASNDETVKLWKLSTTTATATAIQTLESHNNWVISTAFSPDSELLASASYDSIVKLWDVSAIVTTTAAMWTMERHSDMIRSVAFSPNGRIFASGSDDWTVKLWDVSTGCLQNTLKEISVVWSVAFSSDGNLLASLSMSEMVSLWNMSTKAQVAHFNVVFGSKIRFCTDDKYLEIYNGRRVKKVDFTGVVQSEHLLNPIELQDSPTQLSFMDEWIFRDGKRVLWLPPDRRPRRVAVHNDILGMGHDNGTVSFIELDEVCED